MREIKFRAWNKEKNIMVYDNEDGSAYYWDGMYASDVDGVNTILNSQTTLETYDLMQYTGLKDIDGVEIYEGDIIKSVCIKFGITMNELYVVRWDRGQYDLYDKDDWIDSLYNHMNFYDVEVIGNIYENPELLEEI